jgi:hypothetical protein
MLEGHRRDALAAPQAEVPPSLGFLNRRLDSHRGPLQVVFSPKIKRGGSTPPHLASSSLEEEEMDCRPLLGSLH